MTDDRREALYRLWLDETSEEWTQEWRDELTAGETALVAAWDEQYIQDVVRVCRAILERA